MDSIQLQASKLWDLLFDEETAETYQKALSLTATILKDFAQLIWLIICSVFVFGAWFSDTSVKTGKNIRDWVDNQGSGGSGEAGKPVAETGKELLETGRTGVNYLLNQAREQLGLEAQELPAKPAAVKPAASKSTAAPNRTPSASAQTPPQTSASTSAKPGNFSKAAEIDPETGEDEVVEEIVREPYLGD